MNSRGDLTIAAVTALLAILVGAAALLAAPLAGSNPLFLLTIPFIAFIVILMALDARAMFVLLIFTRALLDPLLRHTKIGSGGDSTGAGGLLNLLVIVLFAALLLFSARGTFSKLSFIGRRWMIFLFLAGLAVCYSPAQTKGLKLWLNFLTYAGMAVSPFLLIRQPEERRRWLKLFLWSTVPPIAIALLAVLGDIHLGPHAIRYHGGRFRGTFLHPNILAFYVLLVIASVFYALKSKALTLSPMQRMILRGYLVGLLVVLLGTRTRSAWIGCWSFFFLYGLLKERKYLFIVMLAPLPVFVIPELKERVDDLFRRDVAGVGMNSFAWRLSLWKSSLQSIGQKPLFGHGLGSFETLSGYFFNMESGDGAPAHNVYLEMLFETGALGLAAYLSVFSKALGVFRRGMRQASTSAGCAVLVAFLLSYMLVASVDNMLYYLTFNWYFWFFIGLVLHAQVSTDRERAERP